MKRKIMRQCLRWKKGEAGGDRWEKKGKSGWRVREVSGDRVGV